MSTTIESFQLHLTSQSADKIYDGNNCNVEFYLPVIEIPSEYHIYVSVTHAVIPFTFYNINSTNNTLIYNVNGSVFTLTIPEGNYNITNLLNFLNLNMPSFTVTYNAINNKFTFVHSTYSFIFTNSSTCLSILGFIQQDNNSSGLILISNRAVNLAPIRCICISSNLKTFNIDKSQNNNYSTICSIPINTQPYSIITYENKGNFRMNSYTNIINTIAIKLMDQNGNMINLNGANWSMTLQFDVVNFVD